MADPISRTFLHTSGGPETSWSHWRRLGISIDNTFIQVLNNGDIAICGCLGREVTSGDEYVGALVLDKDTGEVKEFAAVDNTGGIGATYATNELFVGGNETCNIMVAGKPGRNCVNPEDTRHIVWRYSNPGVQNSFACVDLDDAFYIKEGVIGLSDDSLWNSVVLPTNWTTPLTLVDGCCHLYTDATEYGFYYADFLNANWSTTGTAFTGGAASNTEDNHKVACSDDRLYIWHGTGSGGILTEYSNITSDLELSITGPHLQGADVCTSILSIDCDFKFFPKRNELMLAGAGGSDGVVAFYDPTLSNDGIGSITASGSDYEKFVRACEISDTEFVWSFGDVNNDVYLCDVDSGDSTDLAANVGGYQFLSLKNSAGSQIDTSRFDLESSRDGKFVYVMQWGISAPDTMVFHKIAWRDWGTINANNDWFTFEPSTAPTTISDATITANSTSSTPTAYSLPTATDSTESSGAFQAEPTWETTPYTLVY